MKKVKWYPDRTKDIWFWVKIVKTTNPPGGTSYDIVPDSGGGEASVRNLTVE